MQTDSGHYNEVNIFSNYKQDENAFTNGLISLLKLSKHDTPDFVTKFLYDALKLRHAEVGSIKNFEVLGKPEQAGTEDGRLIGKHCCIYIETKIVSGSLRNDQVRQHLGRLMSRKEKLKKLVLVTPDDGMSSYIKKFQGIDNNILHLEWKKVYELLETFINRPKITLFSVLVQRFLDHIQKRVFAQDMAGIIQKIAFTEESEIDPDTYLDEIVSERRKVWNTPREYKQLDGKGRKLLLYDKILKGVAIEVEIQQVKRNESKNNDQYPWANVFAPGSPVKYRKPISLGQIHEITGKAFGKNRGPYQNITREEYRKLTKGC